MTQNTLYVKGTTPFFIPAHTHVTETNGEDRTEFTTDERGVGYQHCEDATSVFPFRISVTEDNVITVDTHVEDETERVIPMSWSWKSTDSDLNSLLKP